MTHSMVAGGFWCNMPQDYVRKFPVTESTRTWAFSNEHKPSNPASKPHWETPEVCFACNMTTENYARAKRTFVIQQTYNACNVCYALE